MSSRRDFISDAGKMAVASGLTTFGINTNNTMSEKNIFIHHVYFYLKNPNSKEDYNKLVEGLNGMARIKNFKMVHIGKPADTNRDVIERGYAVSWLCIFENAEEQAKYQVDPIHLKFIDECKHLWSKVVVYDSVDV